LRFPGSTRGFLQDLVSQGEGFSHVSFKFTHHKMDPITYSSAELLLDKRDKTFVPGSTVKGIVRIRTHHTSIDLSTVRILLHGASNLQLSAQSISLLEAFYSSIKPHVFLEKETILAKGKCVQQGITDIPFEIVLPSHQNPTLGSPEVLPLLSHSSSSRTFEMHETYHGVYITTAYVLKVEATRGLLSSTLTDHTEIFIEIPGAGEAEYLSLGQQPQPTPFNINPDTLEEISPSQRARIPHFRITGHLDQLVCPVDQPLTGEILVEESEVPLRSIDLQLIRIESIKYSEGLAREATEIQSTQVADGDVCHALSIPLYMLLPRHYTCASVKSGQFQVEFELNLLITLGDDTILTESFPLHLYRPNLS